MPQPQFGRLFEDISIDANKAKLLDIPTGTIRNGSLITFNYRYAKHDPYPLLIITNLGTKYYSGLNLHYLTFNDIKLVLRRDRLDACNSFFIYDRIKVYEKLKGAFRKYKIDGIQNIKRLNCDLILNAMGSVRAINPEQVELIRQQVKEQMSQIMNPSANMMK